MGNRHPVKWQPTCNVDRLMQCIECGALATDVAARTLGWLQRADTPTAALCHRCQGRFRHELVPLRPAPNGATTQPTLQASWEQSPG